MNCYFSLRKTRIGEVRLGPLHVLYPSRPVLVLTSTCKEWAPVTGTVTFPKEKRGSPRSALARCTFSLQKTWKSMDRVHSGLTFGLWVCKSLGYSHSKCKPGLTGIILALHSVLRVCKSLGDSRSKCKLSFNNGHLRRTFGTWGPNWHHH